MATYVTGTFGYRVVHIGFWLSLHSFPVHELCYTTPSTHVCSFMLYHGFFMIKATFFEDRIVLR